jgi:LysR family transcriptional regulator, low CO2-responsive transcriptional regulator
MSIMNLDVHQLMVFYYVATQESISIAAEQLCLTQPTVSYHLKSLEQYAGVKLFNIRKQRVFLTRAGQDLFQYTREIRAQLDNVETLFESLKVKPMRIGVTPLLHSQVTAALSKLFKVNPKVNIEILIENSAQIVQEVSDAEIDVGIVLSTNYENYKVKPVRISNSEQLVFVASPGVPLVKKKKVEWADLVSYPIICGQPGSLLHTLVAEKYRQAGILTPPLIIVNSLSTDVLKVFVKEGNTLGLWHIKDVEAEVSAGELKILPLSEKILVPIDFVVNQKADANRPVIKSIMEHIKRELGRQSELGSTP